VGPLPAGSLDAVEQQLRLKTRTDLLEARPRKRAAPRLIVQQGGAGIDQSFVGNELQASGQALHVRIARVALGDDADAVRQQIRDADDLEDVGFVGMKVEDDPGAADQFVTLGAI
jgi:hypothetical protein